MTRRRETERVELRERVGKVLLQRVILLVRRARLLVVPAVTRAQHGIGTYRIGRAEARLGNVVIEGSRRVLHVCVDVLFAERRAGFLRVGAPSRRTD